MDTSSALKKCGYFKITLCMPLIWAPLACVCLGLQVKWNQFSSNNYHHTSCILNGLHAGKWPDLMTSKPDSVSTLRYHWTDHTGTPLEPQVHWDATGTALDDASAQWSPSGDPMLICIIGTHWKTTGDTSTLGCHWSHTGWCQYPVVSQWRSSFNLHNWNTMEHHWKATGKPLEDHWKRTEPPTILSPVAFQCSLGSEFQAHWIATGLPLDYHWLRVRVGLLNLVYEKHELESKHAFHRGCINSLSNYENKHFVLTWIKNDELMLQHATTTELWWHA